MVREHQARRSATLGLLLALTMLLAACGQTATPTNGTSAALNAAGTPTVPGNSSTPLTTPATPTAVPPPYSFPKKWIAAPDGADLPQPPSTVGSFVFSPTAPSTGYLCVASPDSAYDSSATPPFISITTDGGKTWRQAPGSTSRSKSICQMFIDQSNPRDIFVAAGRYGSTDTAPLPLFRSQDGGATWKLMPQPTISGNPTYIIGLAVGQSRIIAMISPLAQAGPPVGTLYASDDGGQSWKPINLVLNGHTQTLGAYMWAVGTTVYIVAGQGCQGCGALGSLTNDPPESRPLDQPLSSGGPTTLLYFKSTDGARTWAQLPTPVPNLSNISLTRSTDGTSVYMIGTAYNVPNQPPSTTVAFLSSNGGASWKQLPTLAGVENGFPAPGSLGGTGIYVLPDGSVIAGSDHYEGTQYGGEAGAFLLRPSDAKPAWKPLIASLNGESVQVVTTSAGVRIWGLKPIPQQAGGFLAYFDLP